MSTPEYDAHIQQFRAWAKAEHGRAQMIADRLKVSKQLVSGWLSGYRTISLDEWTQIQAVINKESAGTQFLEENKSMKTNYLDPRTTPRQAAGNPGQQPKTLTEAKELLERNEELVATLRSELAQAKAAAVASPAKPAFTVPTPAAKPKLADSPTFPTVGTPGAERLSPTPMPASPKPRTKSLPADADTPFKIAEILKLENLDSLLLLLANPDHSALQRSLIFSEVKTRRAIAG